MDLFKKIDKNFFQKEKSGIDKRFLTRRKRRVFNCDNILNYYIQLSARIPSMCYN